MAICLQRGVDCLHVVQLMPLHPKTPPSARASFKSTLVLPFQYRLTQVVLEKRRCKTGVVVIVVIIYNQYSLVNHCYATDLHNNDGGCM